MVIRIKTVILAHMFRRWWIHFALNTMRCRVSLDPPYTFTEMGELVRNHIRILTHLRPDDIQSQERGRT